MPSYADYDHKRVLLHTGASDVAGGTYYVHADARTKQFWPAIIGWINSTTGEKFVYEVGEISYNEAAWLAIRSAVVNAPLRSRLVIFCSCRRLMRSWRGEVDCAYSVVAEIRKIQVNLVYVPPQQNLASKLLRSKRVAELLAAMLE